MLKIENPATHEILKELSEDDASFVNAKHAAARRAQSVWARESIEARVECIRNFRALLEQRKESLAQTLCREVGKPITQARNEVVGSFGRIDFFLEAVPSILRGESVFDDVSQKLQERITFEPLGVVGNISAWNYPIFVGANVFLPALLAGNAVLYKPSEFSTLTGLELASILWDAGVPEDIFVPVIGGGPTGAALVETGVDGLFFTGSYATGKRINEAAAKHLTRVQLELGGKDPVYICEDTDLATAVASTADGAFYNTGQSCCSVERIYVHERVYHAFVEAFVTEVKKFVVGEPSSDTTYIGPLTRPSQVPYLEAQVKDAVAKGAKLLCGGKRLDRRGNYFAPTVLASVDHTMDVMRDESFGPIIGIQMVRDDLEAVRLMNDSSYGLTAGVYTKTSERANKILSEVRSGSVYWNCCDRVSPRLPWSGRGHSGLGMTLSKYGILAFLHPKAWHLKGR